MSGANFVAYHSVHRMGYRYSARPADGFSFTSNKSRAFLERAIGREVWVIEGRRDEKGATRFGLAAVFTPESVTAEADHAVVEGDEGREFSPPVPLDEAPWFATLLDEQKNFTVGFNEIRDASVVAGLEQLAVPAAVEPPPPAQVAAAAKAPVAAAAPLPEPTDAASRVARWLRQRRGNYYCFHCISRETGVMPIAQVNQICRPLQKSPKEWRFGEAPCAGCGRELKAIAYVG